MRVSRLVDLPNVAEGRQAGRFTKARRGFVYKRYTRVGLQRVGEGRFTKRRRG